MHFLFVRVITNPPCAVFHAAWREGRRWQWSAVFERIIKCTTEFSASGCVFRINGLWFARKKHDETIHKRDAIFYHKY